MGHNLSCMTVKNAILRFDPCSETSSNFSAFYSEKHFLLRAFAI